MSLDLDDRQRAMLAEMGVHVWWPQAQPLADLDGDDLQTGSDHQLAIENIAASAQSTWATGKNNIDVPVPAASEALASSPVTERTSPPRRPPIASKPVRTAGPSPTALLPLPEGIASMDWPTLSTTVASCQACNMCLGRQAPVLMVPPAAWRADWLVLGDPPDDAQERAGQPFVDDAGKLLDNMLRAVGVARLQPDARSEPPEAARTAYLTHVLKCRPALPGTPDVQAVAACATYLRREIALLQPKIILAMGRFAMQQLLSEDHPQGLKLPLGKLRGQVWHYQGVPVVVTYPPVYLLRSGQDKARAWEDLCLALDTVQGSAGRA
jgi:DNA polymerase